MIPSSCRTRERLSLFILPIGYKTMDSQPESVMQARDVEVRLIRNNVLAYNLIFVYLTALLE